MMNLANNELIKGVIDVLTAIIDKMNDLVGSAKKAGNAISNEIGGLFAMLGAGVIMAIAINAGKALVGGLL